MMQRCRTGAVGMALSALLFSISPAPITAATTSAPGQPQAASPRKIECRCRANGRNYELGQRICLLTPAGYRVAECRMSQNVTSWAFGGEECALSAALGASEKLPRRAD